MLKKQQYYDISNLIKKHPNCHYYVVFGERSNGKSYSTLKYCIERFYESLDIGVYHSFGYIRRWSDDIKSSNMEQVFKSLVTNEKGKNVIEEITNNEFNNVEYKRGKFFLIKRNFDGEIESKCEEPLGYIFSLSESERIKSTGYPTIKTIMFEEFIAEGLPMVNEFIRFTSVLSTIIRNRNDVKIIMLGNSINPYNIYFDELGLYRAKTQPKNTIDIYEYKVENSNETLSIACEYADMPDRKVKKSNVYFAFNNDKNAMIINGSWQLKNYPHLNYRLRPMNVKAIYFIKFNNEIFQCEICRVLDNEEFRLIPNDNDQYSNKYIWFTYIHRKTTNIKYENKHIIFQAPSNDMRNNIRINIANPYDEVGKTIYSYFLTNKVCYQDNTVGTAISEYLHQCKM